MTLADYQYAYGGLTLGDGTPYEMLEVDGLEGFTARVSDRDLPRGHGAVPGAHYSAARQFLLTVETVGDESAVETAMAALREAFSLSVADSPPFSWKHPGLPERLVFARPVIVPQVTNSVTMRRATPRIAMLAADPRIYSAELHTANLPLYDAGGGGAEFPGDFGVDFSAGASTDVAVTNAGAADAWPTLRWFGPTDGGTVTAVSVANLTAGESLVISTPIGAGQILTFDGTAWVTGSGDQVVGLDGATRYGSWEQPRRPLRLPPGDSVLRFTVTGTSTAVEAVLSWRSTWLS